MEQQTLQTKTINALFWSFWERLGQQGVQFLIALVLARLLMPEEFGLIAMIALFISISQCLLSGGFGKALIQKKDADHLDECSIFYFNIFISLVMIGLLCASAPLIASFYSQPVLVSLIYFLSVNLLLNALGQVQSSLLVKRIDFKTQTKITMISITISGTVAIFMAYEGFGVWSLVAQSLSNNFSRMLMLWYFGKWRPALIFSFSALQRMFVFGSRLLVSGLLNIFFSNIYYVLIGKLFSPATLGFYYRANNLQQLPAMSISMIVTKVAFPVFSSISDDKTQVKNGVRKALRILAFINFPLMIGLAVLAKPLILLLYTEKWGASIPYFQLLCMVGLTYPLQQLNLNVLAAQGHSGLFLRLEVINKFLILIALSISYRFGIIAIIYGQILTSLLTLFISTYYTGKFLDYSFTAQIKDTLPSIVIAAIMGLCVDLVNMVKIPNAFFSLLTQILFGVLVYTSLSYLFKIRSFFEILAVAKSRF